MGMDVFGRNPDSKVGEYFRANVWSWHPIHTLCIELCSDILDEQMLESMAFNDGAGPEDQQTCTAMAIRFDNWLEHHASGIEIESDLQMTGDGRLLSSEEVAANPDLETESPYSTDDDHIKEWVEFLRHCGGFQVC